MIRGSCRQSIVDQNHDAIAQFGERLAVAIFLLAPLELDELLAHDGVHRAARNAVLADDIVAEHANAARRERADGEFRMSGHPDLPHDENVERRTERLRDLEGDGDAAARQREHDDIGAAAICVQLRRQVEAGVTAIVEHSRRGAIAGPGSKLHGLKPKAAPPCRA
jgi:hypothetical protein